MRRPGFMLRDADHMILTRHANRPWVQDTTCYQRMPYAPAWDKARGIDLINHAMTALLKTEPEGDGSAHATLRGLEGAFVGVNAGWLENR